jgi:hypothetical protein
MPAATIVTEELIAKVKADYEAGLPKSEIILNHHISFVKLNSILKVPKGYIRKHYSKEEIRKDYREGMEIIHIMKKHRLTSYSNVYAIVSGEKKRTKQDKKIWKQKIKTIEETTCPTILRLREKYSNYEISLTDRLNLTGNLEPFVTVMPRRLLRTERNK